MAVTEGRLYFVAIKSLEKLEIQFVPRDLSISRTPKLAEIEVIGRNTPQYHYVGGKTELDFQLDFYAEDDNRKDVITKCRWLESLCVNDGFKSPPDQVKLVFGELFRNEIWTVVAVRYKLDNFNKERGYLPQQAYVDVKLALDPKKNLRRADVI